MKSRLTRYAPILTTMILLHTIILTLLLTSCAASSVHAVKTDADDAKPRFALDTRASSHSVDVDSDIRPAAASSNPSISASTHYAISASRALTETGATSVPDTNSYTVVPAVSIEQMMLYSDIVARVRLRNVSTRSDNNGRYHKIAIVFSFDVIEVLKGEAANELTVIAPLEWTQSSLHPDWNHRFWTDDAEEKSRWLMEERYTGLDNRESLIFISALDREAFKYTRIAGALYGFTSPRNSIFRSWSTNRRTLVHPAHLPVGLGEYSLLFHGEHGPASWFPSATLPDATGTSAPQPVAYLAEEIRDSVGRQLNEDRIPLVAAVDRALDSVRGTEGDESIITLAEVRRRAATIQSLQDEGDGSGLYNQCLESMLINESYRDSEVDRLRERFARNASEDRDREWFARNASYRSYNLNFISGLPKGSELSGKDSTAYRHGGAYPAIFLTGEDAELFKPEFSDDYPRFADGGYRDGGYRQSVVSVRPIPSGSYTLYYHWQRSTWIPCGYYPEEWREKNQWFITVKAPDGVLHEAFFDPSVSSGPSGGGVTGFKDGENGFGRLEPATIQQVHETVSSLSWSGGAVTMEFDGPNRISGKSIEFIGLRGQIILTLRAGGDDDATRLSWCVSESPWSDGDLLMIRIRDTAPTDPQLPACQ